MTQPAHILVAESDTRARRTLTRALREDGYDVLEIADGGRLLVEVSRRLRQTHAIDVDLFVCSLQMPVMTGLAFVSALRASHLWMPVILTGTIDVDPGLVASAARLAATVLVAPYTLQRVREQVALTLGSPIRITGT